ncbi:MAG: CHASE3 domain-containing protein [Bacteroidota bacterium]|nr:CHASE3 domain-containing protein [Bacteroidota bacterium]
MKTILKKTRSGKGISIVYFVAFILLLISCLFTLYTNRQIVKQAGQVEHTNKLINQLDNILAQVKDAETGALGYFLTKDIQFLLPYYGTRERTDSLYHITLEMTSDNPVQHQRLFSLKKDIELRFGQLEYQIKSFDANNQERTDTMKLRQPDAIRTMDNIRNTIALLKRTEGRLLAISEEKLQRISKTIGSITVISLALAVVLLVFGVIAFLKASKDRKEAQEDIEEYDNELKHRINELNRANKELIKMKGLEKFAATGRIARTIAHEVRNPLTNINLAVEQLHAEKIVQQDDTSSLLFEMIQRNSARINQLISDLLNSTKFSELNYEKVSVNELLDEALEEAKDRIALANVEIVKKYSKDVCAISVDKVKIKIAMLNLIINAIEAMDNTTGNMITLETKGENNKCKIIISDNGPGLDSDYAARLFEPYFTTKIKGNGLGLTNTQNIILNHKGEIAVETVKGKGTSFSILLDFHSL